MAKYLITGSYTIQGAKGVAAEGGSGRVAAVDKLITSLGGRVESFYFGFGGDDFYVTVELPNNAAAAAGTLAVAAGGGASARTTVLLTPDEVERRDEAVADVPRARRLITEPSGPPARGPERRPRRAGASGSGRAAGPSAGGPSGAQGIPLGPICRPECRSA